jgi:hypothetical protein
MDISINKRSEESLDCEKVAYSTQTYVLRTFCRDAAALQARSSPPQTTIKLPFRSTRSTHHVIAAVRPHTLKNGPK